MKMHKRARRSIGRLALRIIMVAGALIAICAVAMYFAVDYGLFEREPDGIDKLRAMNERSTRLWLSHQVAWLKIYDTHIDYPVMQSTDNSWYLSHDHYGKLSINGSIFLDYRNGANFNDNVSIIYGHRTNGSVMFSDIAKYNDMEYFIAHTDGELVLKDMKYRLRVIGYRVLSADDELYSRMIVKDIENPVLALSTCNRNVRDERSVLFLSYEAE